MNIYPDWNKPGSFSAGRDPLGFQAASVRLYTDLVPGLTNVTNRLRYFSFYCWVVRKFELRRRDSFNDAAWSIFIRRAEATYVLASYVGDRNRAFGMAGSIWAAKHAAINKAFDFTAWTDAPGEDNQYLKARWGNFGQFYVASMQEMGMLEKGGARLQAVTEDYGLRLAEAFELSSPRASELLLDAIDTGRISPDACAIISDEAHPSYLDDGDEETELLTRYLCGEREDDPTAAARRATLCNVLTIVEHAGTAEPDQVRRELYVRGCFSQPMHPNLQSNLDEWRAYIVNELCHVSLEVLLNALAYRVNSAIAPTAASLADDIASTALGSAHASTTLLDASRERKLASLEEEHELGSELARTAASAGAPTDTEIANAVTLLMSLWQRWNGVSEVGHALGPATVAGRSALGVFRLFDDVSGHPAVEAIATVVRKFIVSNHLLIAGHKLASAGTYTYRFIVDDGVLVEGVPAEYDFTNPRIGNLITFAQDAGLLSQGNLTPKGRAFLSAV